jgi:CSLREA domain-containing protein
MKTKIKLLYLSLALALLVSLTMPGSIRAQGTVGFIKVNTVVDEVNSDAKCSLREAVIAATQDRVVSGCAAGSSTAPDQITFDFPGTGDILIGLELTSDPTNRDAYYGDIDLTQGITIYGPPNRVTTIYIVHGSQLNDRVFHVKAPAGEKVLLRNLKIVNGRPGIGLSAGGGIFNEAGSLGVENCIFDSNTAFDAGGAIYNAAGANVTVVSSQFLSNSASRGGAIFNRGTATVINSYFRQNATTGEKGSGGAVYHNSALDSEKLALLNNTFNQNSAASGAEIFSDGGAMDIFNNTVFSASSGSAVYVATQASIKNTIVIRKEGTSGKTCAFPLNYDPTNPPLISGGHNLENQNFCHFTTAGDKVNETGTVIAAAPDASRGGVTPYFWLPDGSPAIDAGAACVNYDQRGFFWLRPGTGCDMGSVELSATETTPNPIFLPSIRR